MALASSVFSDLNGVRTAVGYLLGGALSVMVTSCSGGLVRGGEGSGPAVVAADGGSSGTQVEPAGGGGSQSIGIEGPGTGGSSAAGGAGHLADNGGASGGSESQQYPGSGFIVHEWGTDTIVVGTDGSLQRGLHHEEEDLPAFVYDRIKAASLMGAGLSPSVNVKMETPVTYFYSDHELLAHASVAFPKGVLTQWYPSVDSFSPPVAAPGSIQYPTLPATVADPALDPSFPFRTEQCRTLLSTLAGGRLDWGNFTVRARTAALEKPLASAPLAQFGWSYARAVDSNLVQMPSGESERFLFYRGLGDFDLPVKVQATSAGTVRFTNGYAEAIGRVFVLNVNADHGAFTQHSPGIAPAGTLTEKIPSLAVAPALSEYEAELASAVTEALDQTGLYHDEALAMVNTWRRQWFRTPGVRALYLIPESWTNASIPLTISPQPDATVRVMLIRVELITPAQEASDVAALPWFDADSPRAKAYFTDLGRFAEPRLRRALSLSASASGQAYLAQIAGAKANATSGE